MSADSKLPEIPVGLFLLPLYGWGGGRGAQRVRNGNGKMLKPFLRTQRVNVPTFQSQNDQLPFLKHFKGVLSACGHFLFARGLHPWVCYLTEHLVHKVPAL